MAGNYKIPFQAFTALEERFGSVFQIQLGSVRAVVVSTEEDKKEVLQTKDTHFFDRPNYTRFTEMFGGNRNNSLAFCDMTELQKNRRKILNPHCFPASASTAWEKLSFICREEIRHLIPALREKVRQSKEIDLKPFLTGACSNIFSSYFCSTKRRNYDDSILVKYCSVFDDVFWEINNERLMDMLPWLVPMMGGTIENSKKLTHRVREYVMSEIVNPRQSHRARLKDGDLLEGDETDKDFLDIWLDQVEADSQDPHSEGAMDLECALYSLEDVLGGHTAVANAALRAFVDLGARPDIQTKVRSEIKTALGEADFSLEDKASVPILTAAFHETIRMTCSPVIPHIANRDTSIAGFSVRSGTTVFINNHPSHFSPKLWDKPEEFHPWRFLQGESGTFCKPGHFQPFSIGRRSCIGYKMAENLVVSLLGSILHTFQIYCTQDYLDYRAGMLALPNSPFLFTLTELPGSA